MITQRPGEARRAVVTGIGVVAPNGIGKDAWWEATKGGKSGLKPIQRFDPSRYRSRIAGEVLDFEAANFLDRRVMAQSDRSTCMALAAAGMALQDAGLDTSTLQPETMSVIMASSSGGNEFAQREMQNLWSKGPIFVSAYQCIAWFPASKVGQISIKCGIKGPSRGVAAEAAGGLEALQAARRAIRRNIKGVVAGGTDGSIVPFALACQGTSGRLSTENEPNAAYRPFDTRATGYVPGEGGAVLIVEDLQSAQLRAAPQIYGEIAGCGATNDAYHHSRPALDGKQLVRAIKLALENANLSPTDIDCVFADGAGTREWDTIEANAIKNVFNAREDGPVPVTAPKSMTGRLCAGGAPLDVAAALLSMRDQCIPPTINVQRQGKDCELNLVKGRSREAEINHVLINARGYGGFNGALILGRYAP